MPIRQPHTLPHAFLMTDERMGEGLWPALDRLPRGAGVVFRHYSLSAKARRAVFDRVRAIARRRRLVLLLAGAPRLAIGWRADGVHGRSRHGTSTRPLVRSAPCHDRAELIAARRVGCRLVFVSPIYPTRSHANARTLGRVRAGLMIGGRREDIVALGGMTPNRARALGRFGVTRWAAIDAWLETG